MIRTLQLIGIGTALFLTAVAFYFVQGSFLVRGSAPDGVPATVATSTVSQTVTAGTAELLFATSSDCAARIIGTAGGAIRLTFSDTLGARPTALAGHVQAASTTVAYDSGLYGCHAIWVYPYVTEPLTTTETR